MTTDASDCDPETPSRTRLTVRTASAPTLCGRNVPRNVLTKNVRRRTGTGGRVPGASGARSAIHR